MRNHIDHLKKRLPVLIWACGPLRKLVTGLMLLRLLLLAGTGAAGAEGPGIKEYQLKAAFLYNFTKFVEWPAASFPSSDAPIVIGVLGRNPFGPELESVIKDRKVNGRGLVIRMIEKASDAKLVQLLFVPSTEDGRLDDLAKELSQANVLTVGESAAFAKGGGMINFILEGDKVRFEINPGSAEKAGLKISAQLQKLAKNIRKND